MYKSYKIEFRPNSTQKKIIERTLGTCRYLYNTFIDINKKHYIEGYPFISGYTFDKLINRISDNISELNWIKNTDCKSRKQAIMDADKAFRLFFNGVTSYPKFKKKGENQTYYFIKNGIEIQSRKIKIPILKWLKLKEFDYIPKDTNVISGRILKDYDKYYVIINVEYSDISIDCEKYIDIGLGIDVGIKDYLIISNSYNDKIMRFKNINKSQKVKDIEYKIKQYRRIIANKIEINRYKDNQVIYNTNNILKLRHKIKLLYRQLTNIRNDYIKKICNYLTKTKLKYITIEDLSNQNILINGSHKLSDNWAKCKFYYFKISLMRKCFERGIELRIADKYYASSKICSCCGHKKNKLSLMTRKYKCKQCGLEIDRDDNAAINLCNLDEYKLAY